jgi:hypothetical protein
VNESLTIPPYEPSDEQFSHYSTPKPWWAKLLRVSWWPPDGDLRGMRTSWGEFSIGSPWLLAFDLGRDMDDSHLHIALLWVSVFIHLKLPRYTPKGNDPSDHWGFTFTYDSGFHLHWGDKYKIFELPWRNWRHRWTRYLRADGTWAEVSDKAILARNEDDCWVREYDFNAVWKDGTSQKVKAKVGVEERMRSLRWFPWVQRKRRSIWVDFDEEVGAERGSWKGGTVGCGYDMKLGETARQTLRRMQHGRRF